MATPTETPPQSVPAPAAATASIADQYELGEEALSAATVQEPAASAGPPASSDTTEPATPPRGPDGRFLPSDAAPTSFKHSQRLTRMALVLGLSEADIASTSPEVLDETVYHLNLQALTLARETSGADNAAARRDQPVASAPAPAEEPLAGIKDEDYDPGIAELIRTVRSQAKEIKELKEGLGGVRSFQQARVQESLATQCDRAFSKHEGILGKGRGTALQPTDPHYIRRKSILALVDQMPKKGTLADRIDKAVETLFGTTPTSTPTPKPNGQTLTPEQERWQEGAVARPTQRKSSDDPAGRKKAEATVAKFLNEQNGVSPEAAEEFPD